MAFRIFSFKTNGKKEHLDQNDFRHRYDNSYESVIPKVTAQSFFSATMRHIGNLKGTLQLKILSIWIKIRANFFINTWVNIMKQKTDKGIWKIISCTKIRACTLKNIVPEQRIFTYFYTLLFSKINLAFKFKSVFISIFARFCHNLFTFTFWLLIF